MDVVLRTYDGTGGFTQVDPGAGVLIEERIVIVDDGEELRSIVSSPQAVMISTVQRRVNAS